MGIESCLRWPAQSVGQSVVPPMGSRLTPVLLASVCIAFWSVGWLTARAEPRPVTRLRIPACAFDRGNARVLANPDQYPDYRDTYPGLMVAGGDPYAS